jgi:arylsulfatase A-like enzyme
MWLILLLLQGCFCIPNLIILFADDMGYGDASCFGHPTLYTPNIDRMAYEGLKFGQFYTAYPICSPSRSSLLTGRLPVRNGIYQEFHYPEDMILRVFLPWSTGGLQPSEISIAKLLKQKNYATKIIGKWHLGHYGGVLPTQSHGFDEFFGLPYSQDEGCPPGLGFPCTDWAKDLDWPGVPLYRDANIIQQPVNLLTLVPRYNQEALTFIENNYKNKQPFFLYMAYDEVHVPLFSSPKFANTSSRGLFGDAMNEMDDSIGQILDKLVQLGIDNNTLVFFTSDNGPWLEQEIDGGSAGPFKEGKGSTWEGGLREPAIAWWPGTIAPRTFTKSVATTMDIFATFLDFAGVPLPNDRIIDGKSIKSILLGNLTAKIHDYLFFYRDDQIYAVRYGPYKAHYITRSGFGLEPPEYHNPPLLFNVEQDPSENYPLDTTIPLYQQVLANITVGVAQHNANLIKAEPQLPKIDPIGTAPCCQSTCLCGN